MIVIRFCQLKLKLISTKRWVAFIFLLLTSIYYLFMFYLPLTPTPSISEFILVMFNDQTFICYYVLFFLILIGADSYSSVILKFNDQVFSVIGNRKVWLDSYLVYLYIISLFLIISIAIAAISLPAIFGCKFVTEKFWNVNYSQYVLGHGQLFTIINILLLLLCRIFTFLNIIFCMNLIAQTYPLGIIVASIVSLLDKFFYEMFDIMVPIGILPIEHTRIFYTEAVAPANTFATRTSLASSYLYWVLLCLIIITISKIIAKRKNFMALKSE